MPDVGRKKILNHIQLIARQLHVIIAFYFHSDFCSLFYLSHYTIMYRSLRISNKLHLKKKYFIISKNENLEKLYKIFIFFYYFRKNKEQRMKMCIHFFLLSAMAQIFNTRREFFFIFYFSASCYKLSISINGDVTCDNKNLTYNLTIFMIYNSERARNEGEKKSE